MDFDQQEDGYTPMEEVDPFAKPVKNKNKKPRAFRIKYEWIFWTVNIALILWAVLDRFYWHLFEMALNFPPLTVTLKGVAIPGTVTFFDHVGRITGRLLLVVINGLFWTQCKTTENFFMENHPKWVDMGDARTTNNQIHYTLGFWFLGLPIMLHMFLVFLPITQGVAINMAENRPDTRVTPFIFTNNGNVEMFISFDDLYRLLLTSVCFLLVFPLSISNWARNKIFTLSHWLHIGGALLFTIDQIRRSPHSQIFNTPVIAYFLCDRIVGLLWYRTGYASIIHKEQLDDDYVVVFLYVPKQKRQRKVGSTYYLNFGGNDGLFDMAHPYIAFQNHTGEALLPEWRNRDSTSATHKFYIDRSSSEKKAFNRRDSKRLNEEQLKAQLEEMERQSSGIAAETEDHVFFSNWNTAFVVQVHRNNRSSSFTAELARANLASRIRFWGPFTSEYGLITPTGPLSVPLVLIGTGAGCGPILDYYMHIVANGMELENSVTCYFSTNSVGLFQFFTDLTCANALNNWAVHAHLTQSDDYEKEVRDVEEDHASHNSVRDMKLGRLSFDEVLREAPKNTEVYFCGSPALQWKVQVACSTYKLSYHPGHRFGAGRPNACQRVGPARYECSCSKFPVCLQY